MPRLVESAFHALVRHARWMGRVPILPLFLDTVAQAVIAVGDSGRLRAMRAVEKGVGAWPGVTCGFHRFGGVEFRRNGREFAHLHGCGLLDVRLGAEAAATAIHSGTCESHHVLGVGAWVSVWVRSDSQVPAVMDLLRTAAQRC
ncbi:MAG: DUF5519 family protein [Verrucomicrobiales bacterium]|nr:DUF5519 family protein [Verrucomicrobiales bacterium]